LRGPDKKEEGKGDEKGIRDNPKGGKKTFLGENVNPHRRVFFEK